MEHIRRIGIRAFALVAISTVFSVLFLRDIQIALGLALGGGVELINFLVTAKLIEKILKGVSKEKAALIAVVLAGKFAVLGFSIYFCLTQIRLSPVAFIVGITLVILAMVLEAFHPDSRWRR